MSLSAGPVSVPEVPGLKTFDFEIYTGIRWMSLNDHLNYRVGSPSFESSQIARRRQMVSSVMYDGEWEVHSTLSNITESVVINILGQDQNMVTENYLALEEAFSQRVYNVRKTMGNHLETWRCFPAEWSINRGQSQAHAGRMQVQMSIPRFPKVTYEVIP